MGKYHAYSEYKDSGADWLGDVPVDWNILDLKRHTWVKTGYAFSSESFVDDGEPIIRIGDIQQDGSVSLDGCKYIPSDQAKQHSNYLVYSGELLMAMTGATIGKAGWYKYDIPALVNQRVGVFKTDQNKLNYRFLWFVLKSSGYQEYIKLTAFGGAQPNISDIGMVGYKIVLPTLQEQEAIANFLDHETAKIDTLIEQQQQLIQLLKEKRQAVISHAVTKGLNPDAPMKDSGVEWLGEVPAHWEVKPLKFLLSDKKGSVKAGPFGSHLKNSDMEGNDVKVISQKNVISKDFNIGELMISEEKYRELSGFTIERNDILISTRGTIGRAAVYLNDEIAILHPCLIRIQVDLNRVFPKFVELLIEDSGYVLEQILINSNSTTIEVIYSENLINTVVCLPNNLIEQREILNYVIQKKEYFDSSISKAQQAIELMQERRTALISAAVTGKIDVRNWQAPQQ